MKAETRQSVKTRAKKKTLIKKSPKYVVFATNLNATLDAAGYPPVHHGRQVVLGQNFGISTSAARKWLTGDCLPDYDNLILIADKLNVGLDSLFGRSPRLSGAPLVTIPIGTAMQGDMLQPGKVIDPFSALQMEAEWIETGMRLKHNNLVLMTVSGDNMNPTLADGDTVFVDTTPVKDIHSIEENAIYVIMTKGRQQIRRIQIGLDDNITLSSDNKHFPPVTVPISYFVQSREKPAQIQIIGHIPWAIHRVSRTR